MGLTIAVGRSRKSKIFIKSFRLRTDICYSGVMLIRACMAKIHRATVTEADLNYVGSITIDEALLEASGMLPYQYVNITNVSNAVFWQTYIMAGKKGSGVICLNGPPA